jgi:hypothetical protein
LSDIPEEEGDRLPSGELIEVEGTRLKISKKLYKHAEKERKNALKLVLIFLKSFKNLIFKLDCTSREKYSKMKW